MDKEKLELACKILTSMLSTNQWEVCREPFEAVIDFIQQEINCGNHNVERWLEIDDGTYYDGIPKSLYKHETCKPVISVYPFCPYCGKHVTHVKLINNGLGKERLERMGYICE